MELQRCPDPTKGKGARNRLRLCGRGNEETSIALILYQIPKKELRARIVCFNITNLQAALGFLLLEQLLFYQYFSISEVSLQGSM